MCKIFKHLLLNNILKPELPGKGPHKKLDDASSKDSACGSKRLSERSMGSADNPWSPAGDCAAATLEPRGNLIMFICRVTEFL